MDIFTLSNFFVIVKVVVMLSLKLPLPTICTLAAALPALILFEYVSE